MAERSNKKSLQCGLLPFVPGSAAELFDKTRTAGQNGAEIKQEGILGGSETAEHFCEYHRHLSVFVDIRKVMQNPF